MKNHQDALKLAGRLAMAAQNVMACPNPLILSDRLQQLGLALNEYDNYIIEMSEEMRKKDNEVHCPNCGGVEWEEVEFDGVKDRCVGCGREY